MNKHRKSAMGRSRDLGLDGSVGKGDKSRITNQSAYAANFDEINWGRKPEIFAEADGEWPDVIGIGNHAPTTDIHRE